MAILAIAIIARGELLGPAAHPRAMLCGYRGYGARADFLVMFLKVSGIVDGRLK
jgi:hypothetical protein